ncbi:glycosyltransferase family 4 protein [Cyanobium sp. Cruz-8H5]|uniref:glycosyltransferase family 4 protein n=1 Tax=Cyanobium sp. Cruz-8H5 TaxID=2823712 RepID=UPI0020CD075B|nr:glycosyltransferase family 4 protein [Cyanobium sp. Cruz-8H5]MCP9861502.1 glycosyltransferase family 4 protein [Cyanobium sp. Cruz-8H5]
MNGVNAGIGQLLKGLAGRGHQVALASDLRNRYYSGCAHFKIDIPHTGRSTDQLRDVFTTFRPDVLHYMVLGIRVLKEIRRVALGIPHVINIHNVVPKERAFGRLYGTRNLHYVARLLRYLPNHAAWRLTLRRLSGSQVLVHSDAMRRELVRIGLHSSRISVVNFGCAIEPVVPSSEVITIRRPKLGTIAAFIHTKGIHDVLEMLAIGRKQGFEASYTVVGHVRDQEYFAFLKRRVAALGLEGLVEFDTEADDDRKVAFLRDLDCYVQPSHEEGFCIAFLEAALLSRRAVGTSVGAIREIVGVRPGLRMEEPQEPARLLSAVRALLKEPVEDELVHRRQVELGEEFSWSRFIEGHEMVYARAVELCRRHRPGNGQRACPA